MKAKFVKRHTEDSAQNIFTFWFEPEHALDQIAGQYTEMTIHHEHPDEHGEKHWFTISSSPTDAPLMSITTKFAAEHGSSFKQALRNLKPGDEVRLADPMGDFVLPKDDRIPLIFVAGGIGITPFHSIIKWLYDTKQERDITFIYSVATEREIVFQGLFEHYDMHRTIVVTQPESNWDGEAGQLTGERILELARPKVDTLLYVSGPEAMVETLHIQLHAAGIEKSRLVGDFFPGYTKI